jgi:hypothetical protein
MKSKNNNMVKSLIKPLLNPHSVATMKVRNIFIQLCCAVSRGSRDIFPMGWAACNQIPLLGCRQNLHGSSSVVGQEESSLAVGQPSSDEVVSSGWSSLLSVEGSSCSLERLGSEASDVSGPPRAQLTGTLHGSWTCRIGMLPAQIHWFFTFFSFFSAEWFVRLGVGSLC